MHSTSLEQLESKLKNFFTKNKKVAVAFSGGCDSCLVLALAKKYCNEVKAFMIFSDFQLRDDLSYALDFAKSLNIELQIIKPDILGYRNINTNPENRCYLCKSLMFKEISVSMKNCGYIVLIDGTNLSDDPSVRPGFKALEEFRVVSPLRICGLEKEDVRKLSAKLGLSSASKVSFSCLATKFPYDTFLTSEMLRQKECELINSERK